MALEKAVINATRWKIIVTFFFRWPIVLAHYIIFHALCIYECWKKTMPLKKAANKINTKSLEIDQRFGLNGAERKKNQ